jgi:hypothetical protein
MLRSTEPLRRCWFDFEPPIRHGSDYYLRWTMNVNLKSEPEDQVAQALGMSHLRFDAKGKVIFQQDYWDPTDVLYSRIPLAGWLIRKVKQRL